MRGTRPSRNDRANDDRERLRYKEEIRCGRSPAPIHNEQQMGIPVEDGRGRAAALESDIAPSLWMSDQARTSAILACTDSRVFRTVRWWMRVRKFFRHT